MSKLNLNKTTISTLSNDEMENVQGGTATITTVTTSSAKCLYYGAVVISAVVTIYTDIRDRRRDNEVQEVEREVKEYVYNKDLSPA